MYLKNEELNQIEEFGELLMLPNDIAEIMEIEKRDFISELNDTGSSVKKAYFSGTLKTEVKIRKKAIWKEEGSEFINVDEVSFSVKDLREFKAKLIIQLHG